MWVQLIRVAKAACADACRILLLGIAAALSGCGPYVEPYRYIQLAATPGLEQAAAEAPDLSGLYFAEDMPTQYRLQRPGYTVALSIPRSSYLPVLELTVEPSGLRLVPGESEVPPSPVFCGAWYPDPSAPQRLQFGWSPKCSSEEPWELAFVVTDDSGTRIGEENLRFQLERNGWLVLIDAI